jgi:hypothetical protein
MDLDDGSLLFLVYDFLFNPIKATQSYALIKIMIMP